MSLELGLSDAGLVVPRTADYLDEVRSQFVSRTGLDVDWDDDLVLGELTAIMAQLLGDQAELLQAVYDSFSVNGASGVQLSNIARYVGVDRKRATKGQVTLRLSGTPGVVVTQGKMASGGGIDGFARWVLIEDVTIGAGGTVDTVAQADEAGRVLALAGQIAVIATPVPGWASVTNLEAASPGADAETDTQLRIRRQQSLQLGSGNSLAAIRSKLLALDFVEQAAVIDNPDGEDAVVEGVSLPAHSYLALVLPDTLTSDQQTEILRLLYDNTPVASRTAGTDVVGTVTGVDGFAKSIGFNFATEIAANITGTLMMASGFSAADASASLRRLVEAYIGTLLIGDPLTELALDAFAFQVGGILAAEFLINGVPNLDPTAVQQVVVGTWSVS
jgi:hypothetical protein